MAPAFDAADPLHVALYDELPLWSALAGALLLEHVPMRARRVLDLGCGAGFPLLELAERLGADARVTGLDPWAAGLARAHAKRVTWPVAGAGIVRGDGARLPFCHGAFDLVTSNLGVHNFADPDATLRECRRVLEPGGVLALSSNVSGHMREFYAALSSELRARGDRGALERLEAHVAGRGTPARLAARLARAGFEPRPPRETTAHLRFAGGRALLEHHFIRLGFLPAWREVAGADADGVLAAVAAALDRQAAKDGGLRLTIPLVYLEGVRA